MSVTISIRFLTGRAHLHPWQTHHSEGRVEWPPSHWRLLRALVAVAGRGLTTLPFPDFVFSSAVQPADGSRRRKIQSAEHEAPQIDFWQDQPDDCVKINRLTQLLAALSATPTIWLPKTSGGHTRQYFPIHDAGMVKNTGSAVFDTFATVRKDQPLCFHWSDLTLNKQQQADLKLLLRRMTYFGRAESWCQAEAYSCPPQKIESEGISQIVLGQTHWECVCIEDHGSPHGEKEYRDYLLERRLAPVRDQKSEAVELLPRTKAADGKNRIAPDSESLKRILQEEPSEKSLLRCLLRESGQDIKDGLERPIGARWVHYVVPRAIYEVERPKPQPGLRIEESVNLVRYALNTATVNRPVLPQLTDTLLVADRFRSAVMALRREPSRTLSGHEVDSAPCHGNQHAYWWPLDEDNDGFIDHVIVWTRGGFNSQEIDALRELTRLRQRGGRPDLLVTPTFVGQDSEYHPWNPNAVGNDHDGLASTFVSATPYFCPLHLSHGRGRSGKPRSIAAALLKGMQLQGVIADKGEIQSVDEIVFDYAPNELAQVESAFATKQLGEPVPPRQYFPVMAPPQAFPPLPWNQPIRDRRFAGAVTKDPDSGFTFGTSIGLLTNNGSRFIRAMSFCRRRRQHELKGQGRMFQIEFSKPRLPHPFSIGDQCHFGLGQFWPTHDG